MGSETSEDVIVDLLTVTLATIILLLPVQGFSGIKNKKRKIWKAKMEFSNKDFNTDKVQQYEGVENTFS